MPYELRYSTASPAGSSASSSSSPAATTAAASPSGPGLLDRDLEPPLDRGEVGHHHVDRGGGQLAGGIGLRSVAAGDLEDHVGLPGGGDLLPSRPDRGIGHPDLGIDDLLGLD